MKGCGPNICKILLFIFNGIFFLIGLAVIIVGAIILAKGGDFFNKINEIADFNFAAIFKVALILLIVIGSIMFVIGFCGCCGAIMENTCLLTVYAVFLVIIAIVYLVLLIISFVLKGKNFEDAFKDFVNSTYTPIGAPLTDSLKKNYDRSRAFDFIHLSVGCCGTSGYKQFLDAPDTSPWKMNKFDNQTIPYACCSMSADNLNAFLKDSNFKDLMNGKFLTDVNGCQKQVKGTFYENGCISELSKIFSSPTALIIVFTLIPLLVIIVGVVFSCCLISAIKRYD